MVEFTKSVASLPATDGVSIGDNTERENYSLDFSDKYSTQPIDHVNPTR